jgi:exodeoxyribonuclease V beta subunit
MAAEQKIFDAAVSRLDRTVNLIEASAGTGKTYAIAMLVLRFVTEYSLKIEEILLVTFTRAATEELAERIRKRLVEARDLLEGEGLQAKDQTLQCWADSLEDRHTALIKIRTALADIDRAAVFTIHGFCQRMLQEQALESGQLFDVELQPDAEVIRRGAAEDFWRKNLYPLPQRQCGMVLAHFDTPAKLYKSVAPLGDISCAIEPETGTMAQAFNQFDLAFQDLAAWWQEHGAVLHAALEELVVEGKMKKCFEDDFSGWWHSLCAYFRKEQTQFPHNLNWLQPLDFEALLNGSKVRGAKKEALLERLGLPGTQASSFQESVKRVLLAVRRDFACFVVAETGRRMVRQNTMSYDDLIVRLHRAVTQGAGDLRHILRQRFAAALIDEFQDTDSPQWRIFSTVFGGGGHFLYLIGDPKQAIYRFRGADIHSYFLAKQTAGRTLTLTKNFRSHPGMVAAVNELFLAGKNPFLYEDAKLAFYPVLSAKTAEAGRLERDGLELDNMVYCQLNQSSEKDDGQWSSTKAAAAVMRYVAEEIVNLLDTGVRICNGEENRKLRPGDIAVLVRKNSHAHEYQRCLSKFGVPAVVGSRTSVFQTAECLNLYEVLKSLAQPGDSRLLKKAMTVSWLGLSGDELYILWNDEKLFDGYFSRFQRYAETWLNKGVQVAMSHFLKQEKVILTISSEPQAERIIANIHHLLELVQQAESDNGFGPLQLLQWLRRNIDNPVAEEELRLESDEEAVRIVTMHGSKGLEFPVVFCPFPWYRQTRLEREEMRISCHEENVRILDLGSEQFEERCRKALYEEMAEEMRLLYVAVTRAQYRCYTAWCDIGGRKNGPADSFQSGLGYLLFPEGRVDFEAQRSRLQKLSVAPGVEYVLIEDGANGEGYRGEEGAAPNLTLKRRGRESLYTDWQVTSYSALVSGREQSSPTGPTPVFRQSSGPIIEFEALPSGPNFGNAVHDIFENLPFGELLKPERHRGFIQQKCRQYGMNPDIGLLEKMLRRVVSTPLVPYFCKTVRKNKKPKNEFDNCELGSIAKARIPPCGVLGKGGSTFSLADLDPGKCIKEMGFYFHLKHGDTQIVNDILAREKTVTPLAAKRFKGYLTGFVDLIFQHDDLFYIADYKTNHLGVHPRDYDRDALVTAMASHNYGLQFWLYSLVLHNHLRNVLPEYDYDSHFGGVFYLFVRGMGIPSEISSKIASSGVFHQKPDRDTLEQLTHCFGGR